MRNKHHGHFAFELVDGIGELFSRRRIQTAGGFVEDEYLGAFDECPCDCDTLLLSAGQAYAAFADFGLVALWQLFDVIMYLGHFAGVDDMFKVGVGIRHHEVVVDGAR